jgi:hypothetical protein
MVKEQVVCSVVGDPPEVALTQFEITAVCDRLAEPAPAYEAQPAPTDECVFESLPTGHELVMP